MQRRSRPAIEVNINSLIKQLATSLAIALFRAVRILKRALQSVFAVLGNLVLPIGRLFMNWFVLPLYRAGVTTHLKVQRTPLPTRGAFLFFLSNRYLFHAVFAIATAVTIVVNIQARQVLAQDIGQSSLLYALATDSDVEIVQEQARQEDAQLAQERYLGDGTLMAIPHVDFDYSEDDSATLAELSVPGAISAPTTLPETAAGAPRAPRTRTETYAVTEGDTIGSIAQEFGVNVGTILWSNNLTERQYIRPGDTLKIPPVSGVLVTVKKGDTLTKLAATYNGSEDEIREFNKIASDSSVGVGTELMIPGGEPPAPQQTLIAIASRTREQQTSGSAGVAANIKKPANADTAELPTARLQWPTNGRAITQYYGWNHTGVDIDGDFTSPLYASYDGVVTTAGWNTGGYGLQMIIKHPNGMTTRYAHASKLFVKVGSEVKRGEVIAMMGSTGRSTGSHLHYEVYVNGKRVNPLTYIR